MKLTSEELESLKHGLRKGFSEPFFGFFRISNRRLTSTGRFYRNMKFRQHLKREPKPLVKPNVNLEKNFKKYYGNESNKE